MNIPRQFTTAPQLGAIGLQPYASRNIRLSSALCAFGFALRADSEPATVVVDFETKQPVVTFWHDMTLPESSAIRQQLPTLTASMIGLWWAAPAKYSVTGYDDALHAIRRVFEAREWLIKIAKGAVRVPSDARKSNKSVTTESLHIASVIKASGIPLLAFDKRTFVFGKNAAPIATAIADGKLTSDLRPLTSEGTDPCADWMLAALKYRDWLHRIVRQPDCIPFIEKRDGERCLRISSQMPKTLRREFTRRF